MPGLPGAIQVALETTCFDNQSMNAAFENAASLQVQVKPRKSAFTPRFELRLRQRYDRNLRNVTGNYNDMTAQVVMTCNLYGESSDEALKTQALHNVSQAMDLKEKVCRDTRQTTMISFNDIKRVQQQLAGLDQHPSVDRKVARPTASSWTSASASCSICSTRKTNTSRPAAPQSIHVTTWRSSKAGPCPASCA